MRFGSAVALILLAACSYGPGSPAGAVEGDATRFPVIGDDVRIGGLSALAVLDNGARFLAVSDRAYLVWGEFDRTDGEISAARVTRVDMLGNTRGTRLDSEEDMTDSEGLAISGDGSLNISFEHVHRISKYRTPDRELPYPALLLGLDMPKNGGIEALAIDDRDRLVAVQEVSENRADLPLLRFEDGRWKIIGQIHPSDGFDPVGADFGPDGRYYVLERYVGTLGFRSRIRRFDLTQEGGVFDAETIWQSGTSLGNLEGLSIWTDTDGSVHATMVADDNFSSMLYGGMVTLTLAKSAGTM